MQPGEGALDDPAVAAEAGAVLGLEAGNDWFDPALPKLSAVAGVVVAAVADQLVRAPAWPANRPAYRWHSVDKRDQLGDVVAVAAREREGERDAAVVDEEVVFGAQPSSVNRARARLGAPLT